MQRAQISASSLLKGAARDLLRPPFVVLLVLTILATFATAPISELDAPALVGTLIVAFVQAYASIAITLAATEEQPDTSADTWIKAAVRRRCLWRTVFAQIFVAFLVTAGLIFLIVPGFIVGAAVALGTAAVALENVGPGESVRRSIELTRPARKPVGIVYGTFALLPTVALQIGFYFGNPDDVWLWTSARAVVLVLFAVAQIALTRAFLALGGKILPRDKKPTPDSSAK